MSTNEDQENSSSRKLRPRRSVLTDISNKIAGGLANVAGKVTKKRKLSVRQFIRITQYFQHFFSIR
jgi:hypothetical protein